jgi:hypothetical protein
LPTLEFTRVSRWLYIADGYVLRWSMVGNEWTVKEPGGKTIGVAPDLEGAERIAVFYDPNPAGTPGTVAHATAVLAEPDDEALHGYEGRYLTDGHVGDKVVEEPDDDEELTTMKTCECLILTGDVDEGAPVTKPCTEQVPDKRAFKPGHDAKLKSVLLKAFRAGDQLVILDGDSRIEIAASKLAADRGWSKFMKPAPERRPRKAKAETEVFAGDRGELDPETLEPVGMSQLARVKIRNGTWKDGVVTKVEPGETASAPQLYTVTYQNASKKAVTVRLPGDSDKLELA